MLYKNNVKPHAKFRGWCIDKKNVFVLEIITFLLQPNDGLQRKERHLDISRAKEKNGRKPLVVENIVPASRHKSF